MQVSAPVLLIGIDIAGLLAVKAPHRFRPIGAAIENVPIPDTDVTGLLSHQTPLFRRKQFLFGCFSIGDVANDRHDQTLPTEIATISFHLDGKNGAILPDMDGLKMISVSIRFRELSVKLRQRLRMPDLTEIHR